MPKVFPKLYKKTSTGAIQEWEIRVCQPCLSSDDAEIETNYGQLNSDKIQTTIDIITEGKNIGKKNETTPSQQAYAEAQSKWERQLKRGYVESIKAAEKGEVDGLIEGGIVPMLAHSFAKHGHKIMYPCYVQPKLDGIRCIAILKDGKCTLWSRSRKPITGVPHIAFAVEKAFNQDIVLDGELYNHAYKDKFEKIVSWVRQEEPQSGYTAVQYHVYDLPSDEVFSKRANKMIYMKSSWFPNNEVVRVETIQVNNEAEAMEWFERWREEGYEGAMIRNADGKYVNKRSYDLLKIKEFEDNEFEIIGVEEGRGKLIGHVGAFICMTEDNKEFLAKMSGDTEKLKEYFENHGLWKGKRLTVKYQGLTGANGVPRFPVGVRICEYK